jgi:hypothetical protein
MRTLYILTFVATSIFSTLVEASALKDQLVLDFTERRQCAEVVKLEAILDLVNSAEELEQFGTRHNLTQIEIDDIKAKSVDEAERLRSLQSNTTLMQQCASLEASRQLRAECREMRRLVEIVSIADNQTALQEFQAKHDLSEEWITSLTEKASNASARLEQLRENSTFVAACDADAPVTACKYSRSAGYQSECLRRALSTEMTNLCMIDGEHADPDRWSPTQPTATKAHVSFFSYHGS